jgi:hypothetical protein
MKAIVRTGVSQNLGELPQIEASYRVRQYDPIR